MDMRPEFSTEQQIVLIADDVTEVRRMVEELGTNVGKISVWLVGEKEKPGVFEQLRTLSIHTHPEIAELRLQMRLLGGGIVIAIGFLEIFLRAVWK